VDGAQTLTVSAGTGKVSFGGVVGGTTALTSVTVSSTNGGTDAITLRSVTTSGYQSYTGNATLGADTTLTTTNSDVTFTNTVNPTTASTEGLTLLAGSGNISVTGPVGNVLRLGALSITSAANVTFTNGVTATSFTQAAGSGTTTFGGAEDYTGNFSFTGTALTINDALTVGGTTTVTNSGLFTKNGTGTITAAGGFTQNGTGANSIGANISTTNTALSFATGVTLTGTVTLSTGAGAGDITLSSTVNPTNDSTEGLTLVAGTGNITVTGPVGNLLRLGALTISSTGDATFTNDVTAASFTQAAGSGTTTFNGVQDYTGNFSFTGTNLVQNGPAMVGVDWTFEGTDATLNGAMTVGGNYTFTGSALTVNNSLTVTGSATITNTGPFTSSGNVTLGTTLTVTGTTVNNGTIALGSGNALFSGNYNGFAGSLIGSTQDIEIAFQSDTEFGTFVHNNDTLLFRGASSSNFNSNGQEIWDVRIQKAAGMYVVLQGDVTQRGSAPVLEIQEGGLDLNSFGWIQDSGTGTPVSDTFTGVNGSLSLETGTELRCGNLDSQTGHTINNNGAATITADGDVSISGTFNNPANSTLVMIGTGKSLTATPQIGNLHIGAGTTGTASGPTATITLGSNLSMARNMVINDEGSLDASGYTITIEGDWINRVGIWSPDDANEPLPLSDTRFEPGTGTVEFSKNSGTIYIYGHNRWYVFSVQRPGIKVQFEKGKIQRVLSGGRFRIQGNSVSSVILTRDDTDQNSQIPGEGGTGLYPPAIPDANEMWRIDLLPGASLEMQYVELRYSDARLHPLAVPSTNVTLYKTPSNYPTCFKWIDSILAVYSYTEDSDGNGKIDRIRVTAETSLNYDFSDFSVKIKDAAYEVDTTKGINGFEEKSDSTPIPPYTGSEFYIYLKEKTYTDTDTVIYWRILNNTSLRDAATETFKLDTISNIDYNNLPGHYVLDNSTIDQFYMQTIDGAPPRVAYTLALPGHNELFIQFSEPVFASPNSANSPNTSCVSYPGKTTTGLGLLTTAKEVVVSLSSALDALGMAAGYTVDFSNLWDGARREGSEPWPHDYSTDSTWLSLGRPMPPPYNAYGYEGQKNPGMNWAEDWPNPIAADSFPTANNNTNPTAKHRISDVLISVPPANASDDRYFVWPIWARDSVTTEVAESQYESAFPTGAEVASQTIGLVRDFTGTQWLRDQDITMQVRVNPALAPANLSLHFDTNVADTFRASAVNGPAGLWLPVFNNGSPSGAAFSGIVPWPNDSAHGGGTSLYGGTRQGLVLPASALWNFSIPATDPRVKSVSTLEFFLTLDNGSNTTNPLYVARLDVAPGAPIPANWYRLVRPFSFDIHDVTKQRSNATILNNVIDPTRGERVRLSYQLTKAGQVTIQVFTLDGDLVQVLYRGYRQAGDYTASWDGKNRGGRVVARGMYFIRIVGPDIDEIRKVLVVKE
jgi:hypothetical protein